LFGVFGLADGLRGSTPSDLQQNHTARGDKNRTKGRRKKEEGRRKKEEGRGKFVARFGEVDSGKFVRNVSVY
jgi:hypothetical protein